MLPHLSGRSVSSWAGRDARARPDDAIQAETARITRAAARIISHLDIAVFGIPPRPALAAQPARNARQPAATPIPGHLSRVLR